MSLWSEPYGGEQPGAPVFLHYMPDRGASGHYEALFPGDTVAREGTGKRPDSPINIEEDAAAAKMAKGTTEPDSNSENELYECPDCGRLYDGNAQCPCGLDCSPQEQEMDESGEVNAAFEIRDTSIGNGVFAKKDLTPREVQRLQIRYKGSRSPPGTLRSCGEYAICHSTGRHIFDGASTP